MLRMDRMLLIGLVWSPGVGGSAAEGGGDGRLRLSRIAWRLRLVSSRARSASVDGVRRSHRARSSAVSGPRGLDSWYLHTQTREGYSYIRLA